MVGDQEDDGSEERQKKQHGLGKGNVEMESRPKEKIERLS